jgi:dehydrogenase/reductase SDR family member 1
LPTAVVRIRCDHREDSEVTRTFEQISEECEGIDVLVNCAWGGYERMVEDGRFTWPLPIWEQPSHRWSSMMDAGVRAALVASTHAARRMLSRQRGLIVNISYWAAQKHIANVIYGISKAATDKMTFDMADELRERGITVVSLYPGLVRTEAGWLDLKNSESPEFIGRVIVALALQPDLPAYSGKVLIAAELGEKFGVRDIDGRQPRPLTLETA